METEENSLNEETEEKEERVEKTKEEVVEVRKEEKKRKKSVGDILKERGIIKPLPKKKTEKVSEESKDKSDSKLLMELEKLKTEVGMLKDSKEHTDDRIRDVTEKIGEFRSLVFQRESLIKESDSKIRLLQEEIFNIKPRIIEKEIDVLRKGIEGNQVKAEKLDTMIRDVLKDVKSSKETLDKIRSVENIQKMLDDTRKRVETIEKAKNDVDRLAGKTERFYIEMNERMKDFVTTRAKVENFQELGQELTKSVDSINIRMGALSSKQDMDNYKKSINDAIVTNKENQDKRIVELEKYIKIPEEETKKKIEELKKKEESVSKLLTDLEGKYKKAGISEKTYNETKEKNEKLLEDVAKKINELQQEETFDMKSLPAALQDIKTRLGRIESFNSSLRNEVLAHRNFLGRNVKEIHERIDNAQTEKGFNEEYRGTLKTQTDIMKSTLEAIKKLNEKMNKITNDVNVFSLRLNFFETITMLIRVQTKEEINFYISQLNQIIDEMKTRKLWEETREKMAMGLLSDISQNWKEYQYDNLAAIFDAQIKKLYGPSK